MTHVCRGCARLFLLAADAPEIVGPAMRGTGLATDVQEPRAGASAPDSRSRRNLKRRPAWWLSGFLCVRCLASLRRGLLRGVRSRKRRLTTPLAASN
jgi:hypothetical protein